MAITLEISPAESGQRLLRFLERKLDCPRPMLYRWLRSGQVRVNGGRAKPEYALKGGDLLRLPPQSQEMLRENSGLVPLDAGLNSRAARSGQEAGLLNEKQPRGPQAFDTRKVDESPSASEPGRTNFQPAGIPLVNTENRHPTGGFPAGDRQALPKSQQSGAKNPACSCGSGNFSATVLGADLPVIYEDEELLILNKPAGLAVQGGTGQTDSVADRLREASFTSYVSAPAHRLDLHASGLLAAGKTYAAQAWLHELFRNSKPELRRSYLCWVKGDASGLLAGLTEFSDWLIPLKGLDGRERMAVAQAGESGGKLARAAYECLEVREHPKLGKISLLQAELLTGRKHQIRVQLSARGLPLLGDGRYSGPTGYPFMLHAWRLDLPWRDLPGLGREGQAARSFKVFPHWQGLFEVPAEIEAKLLKEADEV